MCVAAVSATILFSWYFELWTNLVYNLILSLFQTNHEHLFLQGEECLYLNTGDMVSETQELLEGNGTRPVIGGPVGHSTLVSNKQWLVLQVGSSIGILQFNTVVIDLLSFLTKISEFNFFFILLFSLSSLKTPSNYLDSNWPIRVSVPVLIKLRYCLYMINEKEKNTSHELPRCKTCV